MRAQRDPAEVAQHKKDLAEARIRNRPLAEDYITAAKEWEAENEGFHFQDLDQRKMNRLAGYARSAREFSALSDAIMNSGRSRRLLYI